MDPRTVLSKLGTRKQGSFYESSQDTEVGLQTCCLCQS